MTDNYLARIDWEQNYSAENPTDAETQAYNEFKSETEKGYFPDIVITKIEPNSYGDSVGDITLFISDKKGSIEVGKVLCEGDSSSPDLDEARDGYCCPKCGSPPRINFMFNFSHYSSPDGTYDEWQEVCICRNLHVFQMNNGT